MLVRLAIGLPLLVAAALGFALTSFHGRASRAFEQRAAQTRGTVTNPLDDEASFIPHVEVTFRVGGKEVTTRVAVLDKGEYDEGDPVTVLYDPAEPSHVVLDKDRYNAETPFLFWSAVAVGGLLPMLFGWWWVRRLRRLAERPGPAFAVRATVADQRPRRWNRRRRWVILHALDAHLPPPATAATPIAPPAPVGPAGAPNPDEARTGPPDDAPTHRPIGSYVLMTGVVLDEGAGLPAEVKGSLRQGGLVVARVGEDIAWPRRRLRT